MKLRIITHPNPLLSKKSKKITRIDDEIKKLAEDMIETVKGYGNEREMGVALAAIQVGVPLRMTVVKNDDDYLPIINPEIVKKSKEEVEETEGCMSVPRKYGPIKRFQKIKVRGLDLDGKKVEIRAEGLTARILQHEIDHMDGKLFIDSVNENELYTLGEKKEPEG